MPPRRPPSRLPSFRAPDRRVIVSGSLDGKAKASKGAGLDDSLSEVRRATYKRGRRAGAPVDSKRPHSTNKPIS